jgi:DNA-binding MarR family transcriptional regulator
MIPEDPQSQAALIMGIGKLIRNRTLRLQSVGQGRIGRRPLPFGELSMAQTLALMAVKDHEPISITELAVLLGVSPPSASAMVERLVERGILTRETDPGDRRRALVRLSPRAEADSDQIHHVILQDFIQLVQRIGPEMTRKWCEVMLAVREAMFTDPRPADDPAE